MFSAEASFASWFDLNKRGQEERPEHDRAALSPAGSPWMQSYLHRKIEVKPLEEQGLWRDHRWPIQLEEMSIDIM